MLFNTYSSAYRFLVKIKKKIKMKLNAHLERYNNIIIREKCNMIKYRAILKPYTDCVPAYGPSDSTTFAGRITSCQLSYLLQSVVGIHNILWLLRNLAFHSTSYEIHIDHYSICYRLDVMDLEFFDKN